MEVIAINPQNAKTKTLLKKPVGIPLKKAATPKVAATAKVAAPKAASTKVASAKAAALKVPSSEFKKILHKLRSKADKAPTMEDITAEVEMIRNKRYAKR